MKDTVKAIGIAGVILALMYGWAHLFASVEFVSPEGFVVWLMPWVCVGAFLWVKS